MSYYFMKFNLKLTNLIKDLPDLDQNEYKKTKLE